MNKRNTRFLILAIIVVIAAFFLFRFIGPAANKPEKGFLFVKTGTDLAGLKKQLLDEKVLGSLTWFNLATGFLKIESVKPGKYVVPGGMSILNLVRTLRNGRQSPVNFVVTKIRTKEQLAGKIGRAFECDSLSAISFFNNNDSLQPYNLDTNTMMATVLPLTYESKWATTPKAIFEKFYDAYKKFWTSIRKQKAATQGLTIIEAVTLASIVDEETNATKEKGNIASVYMNRMAKGMPLQADPTIKFALKDFEIKRILNKHLAVVSPYNTYKNRGLPPGPVCTPMEETIDAVLDAPKTDYLYFVASKAFDGTHVFSTNYSDHLTYAKAYQSELDKRFGKISTTTAP